MPRKPGKVPAYCLHKGSGRAVVRLNGVDHYLGAFGSEQSHELYARLIAEWQVQRWQARTAPKPAPASKHGILTVEQVLALFWAFATRHYARDGKTTNELVNFKYAMKPLRQLYGKMPARDFGPLALKAVRQHMVDADLCRGQVNARVNRIKRVFKWAVSEELIPASVYEALKTVEGLLFGRTSARETKPIKPVADATVEATLPFVSAEVSAMIRLQRLTGMRPGEVVGLRMCDIDVSTEVWIYELEGHKNRWRGHQRLVPLGPQAQAILKSFMTLDPTDFLFSPTRAEAQRARLRRQARKTPMTPSQARRKPKSKPKRPKRDRFDVASYRRAITYGIKKASRLAILIPHWHPNQLRHSRGTEIRKLHGLEAAQVSLGQARADVTQIYAERNLELAIAIAAKTG